MPKKISQAGIDEQLRILEAMPLFLTGLSEKFSEEQLATAAPKEWSAVQILGHIRSSAEVWGYTIYAMIVLDAPTLSYIHPRDWDKKQGYKKLSFAENLLAFNVNRSNLLRFLQNLSYEDWERTCTFVDKANIQTIYNQVYRMASHEADHRNQLEGMFSI